VTIEMKNEVTRRLLRPHPTTASIRIGCVTPASTALYWVKMIKGRPEDAEEYPKSILENNKKTF
jgi:hypothetical protein